MRAVQSRLDYDQNEENEGSGVSQSTGTAVPRSLAIRPNIAARLFEESMALEKEDAERAGIRGYLSRALVQATLPYREPSKDLAVWTRRAGEIHLLIKPGYYFDEAENTYKSMGFPYGTIPRLLLAWLGTEAALKKRREIVLGDSLAAFMNEIGLTSHTGGKNGSITRVREMMKRLFSSDMAVVRGGAGKNLDFSSRKFNIADDTDLWWDPQRPDQAGLWQSTVTLSEKFFTEIIDSPVPVNLRCLRALRQSPMALDLYCWLTYRMFSLTKPTTVPWEALKLQFGSGASEEKKFRETLKRALLQVKEVYPAAHVMPVKSGLYLEPSLTSVPKLARTWEPANKGSKILVPSS
jgi:hypothetical protein